MAMAVDARIRTLTETYGQSLWLDGFDRRMLEDGSLAELVGLGVHGVTSNPTLFREAVGDGRDYTESMRTLIQADHDIDGAGLAHWLMLEDARRAADLLLPVYEQTAGRDGFVSVEVPPYLAHREGETVAAAMHLHEQIGRPNVMIKVPGTREGLHAFERLTGAGVNVNVTLLFSPARYRMVTDAYLRGLARNADPSGVRSVASFFLSRIDVAVDRRLAEEGDAAQALRGATAIACARLAYRHFGEVFGGEAFRAQESRGALPQRLLWASTATKRPDERETRYVEALIGPDTVVTVPRRTLEAFLHDGEVLPRLTQGIEEAERHIERLEDLGIDLAGVAEALEEDGIARFTESWSELVRVLQQNRLGVARRFAGGRH